MVQVDCQEPAMQNASHTIRKELYGILAFIGVIWAVFLVSLFIPRLDDFGVQPRTPGGLIGIPAAPFLHESLDHVLSNTVPLFILLALLAGSRARSWEVVVDLVLVGGLLLWIFGRPAIHIGASGLIFGLITFLITSGFLEKRLVPLTIAVIVGFVYGSTLISGILPRFGSHISWDGHLSSAVAGVILAYALTRESGQQRERLGAQP
jgi:membrane associated rhomboid family serine protease